MREYKVYNLKGELIYQGNVDDVVISLDTKRNTVYNAAKKGIRLKRKYYIKEIKEDTSDYLKEIDYLIRHLERYGNTVLPEGRHPSDYLDELKKRGYECDVNSYANYGGEHITLDNPSFSKRIMEYDYILTLRR